MSSESRGPYRFIILISSIRYVYAEDRLMWRARWYDSNANKGDSTLLALLIEYIKILWFVPNWSYDTMNIVKILIHFQTIGYYKSKKKLQITELLDCKLLRVYDSKSKNIHEELVFYLRYFSILSRSQIIKSYSKKLIEYLNRQSHSAERACVVHPSNLGQCFKYILCWKVEVVALLRWRCIMPKIYINSLYKNKILRLCPQIQKVSFEVC